MSIETQRVSNQYGAAAATDQDASGRHADGSAGGGFVSGLPTMALEQQPAKLTLRDLDAMRGKIVGRVTVTGYVEQSASPWFVPGDKLDQLRQQEAL